MREKLIMFCKKGALSYLALMLCCCSNDNTLEDTQLSKVKTVSGITALNTNKNVSINKINSTNWMSNLLDGIDIREVSIPATHDSGTNSLMRLAKCQDLSISDQLNAGIRFLDIRVTPQGAGSISNFKLKVSHTFVSSLGFKDVLNDVKKFLTTNPTETILIKISRDSGADYDLPDYRKENVAFYNEYNVHKNNIKIENFFTQFLIAQEINDGYSTLFTKGVNINDKIPMSNLRGKAVLFYDYSKFPLSFRKINSLSVGLYEDNLKSIQLLPTNNPVLLVQDYYKNTWYSSRGSDESIKRGLINDFMLKRDKLVMQATIAKFKGVSVKLPFSFNYISMSGVVTTPYDYSKNMNAYFFDEIIKSYGGEKSVYVTSKNQLKYNIGFGVTFFDFPSNELIKAIYSSNF